jgi:hypothetical protein
MEKCPRCLSMQHPQSKQGDGEEKAVSGDRSQSSGVMCLVMLFTLKMFVCFFVVIVNGLSHYAEEPWGSDVIDSGNP